MTFFLGGGGGGQQSILMGKQKHNVQKPTQVKFRS